MRLVLFSLFTYLHNIHPAPPATPQVKSEGLDFEQFYLDATQLDTSSTALIGQLQEIIRQYSGLEEAYTLAYDHLIEKKPTSAALRFFSDLGQIPDLLSVSYCMLGKIHFNLAHAS